ncbi:MAG: hypothetical protein J5729_02200 [Bacteroidaceae bacterium]|nr:hypothetical protein [Bacteroidaceae bacterium]MBO4593808.1 hypothetical protein [Bacteroidaceae bacterium]MBR4782573.1 hypothetical protein [Bacteroidaceae bacterium]
MRNDYNSPLTPYARKVQHGMAVANRKMMTRASVFGYSLVVGAPDGTCSEKDARQLMDELRETPWWKTHFDD